MKRFFCLTLSLLFLCGCSSRSRSFSLNRDSLNTSFKSEINGTEYRGNISFDEKNNMFLILNYPKEISGLSLYFDGKTVSSTYERAKSNHSAFDYSENFAFLNLYNAICNALTDGGFILNSDSAYELDFNGVTLIADKDGNLTSARAKNASFIF